MMMPSRFGRRIKPEIQILYLDHFSAVSLSRSNLAPTHQYCSMRATSLSGYTPRNFINDLGIPGALFPIFFFSLQHSESLQDSSYRISSRTYFLNTPRQRLFYRLRRVILLCSPLDRVTLELYNQTPKSRALCLHCAYQYVSPLYLFLSSKMPTKYVTSLVCSNDDVHHLRQVLSSGFVHGDTADACHAVCSSRYGLLLCHPENPRTSPSQALASPCFASQ
jgi:hypothetical protein